MKLGKKRVNYLLDNQRLWWPSWILNHYEIYQQLFRTPRGTFLESRVTLHVVVWKKIENIVDNQRLGHVLDKNRSEK